MEKWVLSNEASHIFWLNGMAGTGKSTIARTVAYNLNDKGVLGASFFFARDTADVSETRLFFVSIAKQLAMTEKVPGFKESLCEAITQNGDITSKEYGAQWRILISEPLRKLQHLTSNPTLVILIDALDECGDEQNMKGIVALLLKAKCVSPVRLRIILTSRPESPIRSAFAESPAIVHRDIILQDLQRDTVNADIRLYLCHMLKKPGAGRPQVSGWPSEAKIDQLVHSSGGLFLFAATVIRFMEKDLERTRDECLALFLPTESEDEEGGLGRSSKEQSIGTRHLDAVYNKILRTTHDSDRLKRVLSAIVTCREPLSADTLEGLLEIKAEAILRCLDGLHSLIRVPSETFQPIRTFHASFTDFLHNEQRTGDTWYWVNRKQCHQCLYKRCVKVMIFSLKRDICELKQSGILVSEMDRTTIMERIKPCLQYACRSWIQHVLDSDSSECEEACRDLLGFMRQHFLHWLEVMGWMGQLADGGRQLVALEKGFTVSISSITTLYGIL
jgi:hypothetical protein